MHNDYIVYYTLGIKQKALYLFATTVHCSVLKAMHYI